MYSTTNHRKEESAKGKLTNVEQFGVSIGQLIGTRHAKLSVALHHASHQQTVPRLEDLCESVRCFLLFLEFSFLCHGNSDSKDDSKGTNVK